MASSEKRDRYVSIAEAVAATGVSRATIERWVKAPDSTLRTQLGRTGRMVWLDDVFLRLGEAEKSEEDIEFADEELPQSRLISELVRALALSTKHVENLLEPVRKLGETYTTENNALRARNKELEDRVQSMFATYENALTQQHARQMAEEREKRDQARLQQAFEMLIGYAPAVIAGVAGHFGVENLQEAVLVQAVTKLTDEQLRAMVAMGGLGPEALAVIERVRATRKNGKPQEAQGAKA